MPPAPVAECPGPAQGSVTWPAHLPMLAGHPVTPSAWASGADLPSHGSVSSHHSTAALHLIPSASSRPTTTVVQNSLWALGSPRAHEKHRLLDPQAHGIRVSGVAQDSQHVSQDQHLPVWLQSQLWGPPLSRLDSSLLSQRLEKNRSCFR